MGKVHVWERFLAQSSACLRLWEYVSASQHFLGGPLDGRTIMQCSLTWDSERISLCMSTSRSRRCGFTLPSLSAAPRWRHKLLSGPVSNGDGTMDDGTATRSFVLAVLT